MVVANIMVLIYIQNRVSHKSHTMQIFMKIHINNQQIIINCYNNKFYQIITTTNYYKTHIKK